MHSLSSYQKKSDTQIEKLSMERYHMDVDDGGAPHLEVNVQELEQAKNAGWRSLFYFTSKSHVIPLTLAIFLALASGIIIPALAIFLGKIFDCFTSFGAGKISGFNLVSKVSVYGIALAGLGSASGLLNAGYFMFWLIFGELQAKSVRDRLFDGMLEKNMAWYDMRKDGIDTLMSRLQSRIRELQLATSQPLGFVVQYTVTAFAALSLALYTAWDLTLVTLATVPVSAIVLAWISAKMQPSIDAEVEDLTHATKLASNAIVAIDTVKVFNGQKIEVSQYAIVIQSAAKHYLIQAHANASQIGFVRLVTLGMFVQGFWYGSHVIDTGNRNPGQILTAFWACLMATQAVEQILPHMIVLEKGRAAGATLKAVLLQMEGGRKITRMLGRKTPRYCEGDIEIRNVSFAYPSRTQALALNKATFFFPAGDMTFVVGSSGSGKSTLGNLLMHFYLPQSGELYIDGNSIQTLDINWLRNNVTLVQQQSVLFNETIFRNIAFGRRDHNNVRQEEVKRSINLAALQHTLMDMPKGLDTLVGTGGSAMSGGQGQRVAIARARLRDTPILILDEATSALDHATKTTVMDNIRNWRRGKTTIVITHDISQILENDFVYVLKNGCVVQEGYRNALEKSQSGPFTTLGHPIEFPTTEVQRNPRVARRRPNAWKITSEPQTTPIADSLDIQVHPRLELIPTFFGPGPDVISTRRASHGMMTQLSPIAYQMRSTSTLSALYTLPRNTSMRNTEPWSFVQPAWEPVAEGVEMLGMNSLQRKRSEAGRRQSEASPGPPTKPPRLKIQFIKRKRRRKPSATEKVDRVSSAKKILLTVWPTLSPRMRLVLIVGFTCAAIHAAATPIFSFLFAKLLATFFLAGYREKMALIWSMSVLGVAIGDAIASYFMHFLLESCGQAWVDSLRVEALKRILDQPRAWFDREKNSLSRLTECLDRNAEEMRNLVGRFAGYVFVAITMMTMAIAWSIVLCWKLTLVGLACAPALYLLTRTFESISAKWEGKSNGAGTAASDIFTETFGNIRTVRALTLEGYFHKKYAKATDTAMKIGLRRSGCSGLFFGLSDSSIIFVTALIFYYGAKLAASDQYSVQQIISVFTMLLFSISNVNAIVAFIPQISSSRDTATRLLRLASLPYKTSYEHQGVVRVTIPAPITLTKLNFAYPSRATQPILCSFSLTIDAATTTALVGASGSGKSTVASLLMGLYPCPPHTVYLHGCDITSLNIQSLRSLIAVVPQTPTLFALSIAHNITYGLSTTSPLASHANVREAARAAGIDDFVLSLSKGYNTAIGEGGTGLSGGQAQRVAIARAIVRQPKLLIMDEATSGLDGESASKIRDCIKILAAQGVTVLLITHDRNMMKGCERIVVMEKGQAVEIGHWKDLMSRQGALRRLMGEEI